VINSLNCKKAVLVRQTHTHVNVLMILATNPINQDSLSCAANPCSVHSPYKLARRSYSNKVQLFHQLLA
jgi:hypothetical protein